jgi:hypothetical protein
MKSKPCRPSILILFVFQLRLPPLRQKFTDTETVNNARRVELDPPRMANLTQVTYDVANYLKDRRRLRNNALV